MPATGKPRFLYKVDARGPWRPPSFTVAVVLGFAGVLGALFSLGLAEERKLWWLQPIVDFFNASFNERPLTSTAVLCAFMLFCVLAAGFLVGKLSRGRRGVVELWSDHVMVRDEDVTTLPWSDVVAYRDGSEDYVQLVTRAGSASVRVPTPNEESRWFLLRLLDELGLPRVD